eukprot:scaffold7704_cov112-Isochrysis_galbana.AAC.18
MHVWLRPGSGSCPRDCYYSGRSFEWEGVAVGRYGRAGIPSCSVVLDATIVVLLAVGCCRQIVDGVDVGWHVVCLCLCARPVHASEGGVEKQAATHTRSSSRRAEIEIAKRNGAQAKKTKLRTDSGCR